MNMFPHKSHFQCTVVKCECDSITFDNHNVATIDLLIYHLNPFCQMFCFNSIAMDAFPQHVSITDKNDGFFFALQEQVIFLPVPFAQHTDLY